MGDIVRDVVQKGFFENLKNAVIGVFVGIAMFFGSFALLFWNEGRVNFAAVAKEALVAEAAKADPALDGKLVAVTGTIAAKDPVGDPDLVKPGPWVVLERRVETFAWTEDKKKETRNKLGGGTEEVTTYTYKTEWTHHVENSADFREPKGHENPAPILSDKTFSVAEATIGAWRFAPTTSEVDTAGPLEITAAIAMVGSAAGPTPDPVTAPPGTNLALATHQPRLESAGSKAYIFIGNGTLATPKVGDARVAFEVLPTGTNVTLFGRAKAGVVDAYPYKEGETPWIRCLVGTRETAIHTLAVEDAIIRWILRAVGFLLMWFGMTAVFQPLEAVANIFPFLGKATHFAIGCATFPVALVLTVTTIVVSLVLHSLVATVVVAAVIFGVAILVFKSRKPKVAA